MHADNEEPTPTAADDLLRAAFAGVVAAVIDAHPIASPAREAAIREIVACHGRLARLLASPPDVSELWLSGPWLH